MNDIYFLENYFIFPIFYKILSLFVNLKYYTMEKINCPDMFATYIFNVYVFLY